MKDLRPQYFKTLTGKKIPLPIFFPDATRAVLKTLDSTDIENTQTLGVLVNTFHLFQDPGHDVIKQFKGVRNYMNWDGGVISDSGGFQVMSLAKTMGGNKAVTNKGVTFKLDGKKILFTAEMSIKLQLELKSDMVVVLDDFTDPKSTYEEAKTSVDRTLMWAKECRQIFDKLVKQKKLTPDKTPYLLGVVQGGGFLDLRKYCTQELVKIGFDGLGYGGWPIKADGTFDYEVAKTIAENTPKDYFLYALGIGKPHEVTALVKMGWNIFDCVLPTRDARHKRLYVINDKKELGYEYYTPDKSIYYRDTRPVSAECDCLLCQKYSRSYLAHLFRIKEITALRLATIHNLRFYSQLMEKLRDSYLRYNQIMKNIILVTGGAGHIGSNLIEELVKDPNNQVISLDNYSNGSKDNHIDGAEYREGHTKDIDKLIPETPDIVYHLGEYARVAPSFDDVQRVFDQNICGTFAVLEFCRQRLVKKLVYAGSSTKFAIEGDGRHQNPYSFSKATNVDLINDYGRWYKLPYAICYFYNAFGPKEKGEGKYATLIAKFENDYLNNRPLTVVKPGTQKRNFTYVKDLATGIILVGQKGQGDGYALDNPNKYSIIEIAEAFGGPIEYIDGYPGRNESDDAPQKAHQELGWQPTLDVMDYIKDFVAKNPRT